MKNAIAIATLFVLIQSCTSGPQKADGPNNHAFPILISNAIIDTLLAFDQSKHEEEFWGLDTTISTKRNISLNQKDLKIDTSLHLDKYIKYNFKRLYYYKTLPPLNAKINVVLFKAKSKTSNINYVFISTINAKNNNWIDSKVLLINGNPIDVWEYKTGAIINSYSDIKTLTETNYFGSTFTSRNMKINKNGQIEVNEPER